MNKTDNFKKTILVIQPSDARTGPVLGAIALCKLLSHDLNFKVLWISLKEPMQMKHEICMSADYYSFSNENVLTKYFKILRIIIKQKPVAIFSSSFRADIMSFFLITPYGTKKITGPRGDLYKNYMHDYGKVLGFFLAFIQYFIMNFFDEVIAISEFMQKNRPFPLFRNMKLMPNFIDEESVTKKSQEYPIDPFDILFLGRMSAAKGPNSLIKVIDYIKKKLKIDLKAYFIGDGKELLNLKRKISELGLENNILFTGFLENPYPYIKSAKALVLPSESEGVSRAVLEALFLQTPVVVADQQASIELIYPGQNGELYNKESNALVDSIIKSLSLKQKQNVFLPTKFRQKNIREILKEIIK